MTEKDGFDESNLYFTLTPPSSPPKDEGEIVCSGYELK